MQLITLTDIKKTVKQISDHIDEERIKNAIIEAQEIDLSPIISEQVYISIIEKKGQYNDNYKKLMDGCIYEYKEQKYELRGIKVALCYFAYARIISGIDVNVTRTGFMQKEGDYSVHALIKEKIKSVNEAASTGSFYANKCLDFISRNPDTFPTSVLKPQRKKSNFNVIGD